HEIGRTARALPDHFPARWISPLVPNCRAIQATVILVHIVIVVPLPPRWRTLEEYVPTPIVTALIPGDILCAPPQLRVVLACQYAVYHRLIRTSSAHLVVISFISAIRRA